MLGKVTAHIPSTPKAYEVKVRDPAHSFVNYINCDMCAITAHSAARLRLAGMGGSSAAKFSALMLENLGRTL